MPEYDHTCKSCGHEFTVKKPIMQATRREECPKCQGEARRSWGSIGIGTKSSGSGSGGCEPSSRFS